MDVKVCQLCGRDYSKGARSHKAYAESKFCSRECGWKSKTVVAAQKRNAATRQCRQCGKSYGPRYGQWLAFENSRYCSQECMNHGQQRSMDKLYSRVKIDPLTGCHEWQGFRNKDGYGSTRFMGKHQGVHRITWIYKNGPVPEGLELDHICRNRCCCNPEHLRAVTRQVNILAGYNACADNARKTHCPTCGGEYDRVNTRGARYCRVCLNKRQAENMRRRCAADPEFKRRRVEINNEYSRMRYKTDPEYRAARLASKQRSREKLKKERE